MGGQRKPTAHLKLIGAFDKNPSRKRESEPVCDEPIGKAPARLDEIQTEAWEDLVASADSVPGVLTRMDRAYLELCSIALAGIWSYNANEKLLSTHALKSVGYMLGKLGMTPAVRTNLVIERHKPREGGFRPTR